MSSNPYQSPQMSSYAALPDVVSHQTSDVRLQFIRRVYVHLGLAILALMAIELVIFTFFAEQLGAIVVPLMTGWTPLLFFGAFFFVTSAADRWARTSTDKSMQYLAFFVYVIAEAIFLVPLLWMANSFFPGAIQTAGIVTGAIFTGLTVSVFVTRVDFSFLRTYLVIGSFAALGMILAGFFIPQIGSMMGGVVFPGIMIMLACGYILYDTSRIMQHYHTEQYVAASLALFASVVLLFWYVLRLIMAARR